MPPAATQAATSARHGIGRRFFGFGVASQPDDIAPLQARHDAEPAVGDLTVDAVGRGQHECLLQDICQFGIADALGNAEPRDGGQQGQEGILHMCYLHIFVDSASPPKICANYTYLEITMKHLFWAICVLLIAGCTPHIQTSSGETFVQSARGQIDPEIAEIAGVEPNLRFPARIGVARVVNAQLTLPPPEEVALFTGIAQRNANLGEFVPVSPLVHAMVNARPTDLNQSHRRAQDIIGDIRRAGARQHLDYVIIYEVGARSRTSNTPFALADVTLVGGMLLPTRNIDVLGIGAAAMVDVRNGYPYGTAEVSTDLSGLSRTFQADRRSAELRARATLEVARVLVPDVEILLQRLAEESR